MIFEKYSFDAITNKNHINFKTFNKLFESPHFVAAAKDICGDKRPVLQPYELLLAIQMPGQISPLHLGT